VGEMPRALGSLVGVKPRNDSLKRINFPTGGLYRGRGYLGM